jgi:hypothetical protein
LRKINSLRRNKKISGKARSHTEVSLSEEEPYHEIDKDGL